MSEGETLQEMTPAQRRDAAVRELIRRKRCQESLHAFVLGIDVPFSPIPAMLDFDEELMGHPRLWMAKHIALICAVLDHTLTTPFGRSILMCPPGSAKSSYANAAAAWMLGRRRRTRGILASFNQDVVDKQSRRVQQIVKQENYRNIWDDPLELVRDAMSDWALSNESELVAAGLLGGITSNRADFIIIDDPIKNKQQADSEQIRKTISAEYAASVKTRLLPGAPIVIILTRWHELDIVGEHILPDSYAGESGMIRGKDGMMWNVLNLQAKCERADDPLGRQIGEYLWTDFYPPEHWQMFEYATGRDAQRTWGSLFQQRPTPIGNEAWQRDWFRWEDPSGWPPSSMMRRFVTVDVAVTEKTTADWSVFFCWGIDYLGDWYLLGSWEGQVDTDKSLPEFFRFCRRHGVRQAYDEKGVIHNAIAPALNKMMRKRGAWRVIMQPIGSSDDKIAKTQAFKALASTGVIHLPNIGPDAANAEKMFTQLEAMPAGRWDDHADAAGLAGRVQDIVQNGLAPATEAQQLVPFTSDWIEFEDKPEDKVRYL